MGMCSIRIFAYSMIKIEYIPNYARNTVAHVMCILPEFQRTQQHHSVNYSKFCALSFPISIYSSSSVYFLNGSCSKRAQKPIKVLVLVMTVCVCSNKPSEYLIWRENDAHFLLTKLATEKLYGWWLLFGQINFANKRGRRGHLSYQIIFKQRLTLHGSRCDAHKHTHTVGEVPSSANSVGVKNYNNTPEILYVYLTYKTTYFWASIDRSWLCAVSDCKSNMC